MATDHGQCYLNYVLVGASKELALSTHDGFGLQVGDSLVDLPYAGITIDDSGLLPDTTYYVYCYLSSPLSFPTLEVSTTGHGAHSGTGVEVKNGDASRTLVGAGRTDSAGEWAAQAEQQFCISWFQRKPLNFANGPTANRTFNSTSYVEIDTTARAEFLHWGYGLPISVAGAAKGFAGQVVDLAIGLSGTSNILRGATRIEFTQDNVWVPFGFGAMGSTVEPGVYYYVNLVGRIVSGAAAGDVTIWGGGAGTRSEWSGITPG